MPTRDGVNVTLTIEEVRALRHDARPAPITRYPEVRTSSPPIEAPVNGRWETYWIDRTLVGRTISWVPRAMREIGGDPWGWLDANVQRGFVRTIEKHMAERGYVDFSIVEFSLRDRSRDRKVGPSLTITLLVEFLGVERA